MKASVSVYKDVVPTIYIFITCKKGKQGLFYRNMFSLYESVSITKMSPCQLDQFVS